jgi:DNA-binding transcriptional LysR family regulator
MDKRDISDLLSFVIVAREGSFTRAAARIGVTQSALSQTIRALEERLDVRLLTRTTRSVSPTTAGERLVQSIGQRFDEIETELELLTELRKKPAGTVRITCSDHILGSTLLPKITPLLLEYPDIHVEFDVNYGFRDIVADRFDAGVRLGDTIDKDMIAVPISPKLRMAAVAAPAYFARNSAPATPRELTSHRCINLRFPTHGALYVWDFEKNGEKLNVRVDGQITLNSTPHIVQAALQGLGIAYLPEQEFEPHLKQGKLLRILPDWCPLFDGYYLYYPSRRQPSQAFSLVVSALRHRQPTKEPLKPAPSR